MMKTLFCAIAFTSGSTRALLTRDGKVLDRFFSSASKKEVLEDLYTWLGHNLFTIDRLSCIVLTGYGRGHIWADLKAFLKKKDSHSLFFEMLQGPDVKQVLTMDTWFQEDPAYRKLELVAHLCARSRAADPDPPEQVHLEWVLNKTRDQLIHVQQKLQKERDTMQFTKIRP